MAFYSKDHLQVLERCPKSERNNCCRLYETRSTPNPVKSTVFYVEFRLSICVVKTSTFFVLYCQYFLRSLLFESSCRDLWPMLQAVLLTFKYFQRAHKNKLQQQGSFTQILNGLLKSGSWLGLAGGCQELLGPQLALYALLLGDHRRWRGRYTHEGSGRVRARWLHAPAAGAGFRRRPARTMLASVSSRRPRAEAPAAAPAADKRPSQAQAGPSTCPGCRRRKTPSIPAVEMNLLSPVTTDCRVTVMQRKIKRLCRNLSWLHSSPIFGPKSAFRSITSLLLVFPSLLPSLLLRSSTLHSSLHVITPTLLLSFQIAIRFSTTGMCFALSIVAILLSNCKYRFGKYRVDEDLRQFWLQYTFESNSCCSFHKWRLRKSSI